MSLNGNKTEKQACNPCHAAFCRCTLFISRWLIKLERRQAPDLALGRLLRPPQPTGACGGLSACRVPAAPLRAADRPNPSLPPPDIGQVDTYRCTRGYSTPGSQPMVPCTRIRRGPQPCTDGFSAGCRWSTSPSTGSMGSTPATVHPLPQEAQKR